MKQGVKHMETLTHSRGVFPHVSRRAQYSALALCGGAPVRTKMLGYGRQLIESDDIAAVNNVLEGDYLTCGPATAAFEEALSRVTGAPYVTAVSNGTAALHVACLAAGVKSGDEVIVSSVTFAASANCVLYCGGIPKFADIDSETWNISPSQVERLVTPKTKAIIAVDFGGVLTDLRSLRKICDRHGLLLIEDAAHSIGGSLDNVPVGSIADVTCFSFHPVKTITCGEGGAVATHDPTLAKRIELFAKHGITRDPSLLRDADVGGWHYEQLELGYNYRMTDIQAALGTSQLSKLNRFAARRREIVATYNDAFSRMSCVRFQKDSQPDASVRHLYCLWFNTEELGVSRGFIYDALRAEGVGVNVHYLPVYRLPYYEDRGYPRGLCPNAERYYEGAITLPLHCCMSDSDVSDVIKAVWKVVEACRCNE